MQLRVGYRLAYECAGYTPMIMMTHVHYTRAPDIAVADHLLSEPVTPVRMYRDSFGNLCTRLVAPLGGIELSATGVVNIDPKPEPIRVDARQHPVDELPDDVLIFLMGSRYCETDRLSDLAWSQFGGTAPGWHRVQAICDFVHRHITFGYEHASPMRSALEAYQLRRGVCRDFAHLAVTFCRAVNIPARYCSGYLSDVGVPPPHAPMDFAAWIEVYLGGAWHTFDPRNNERRVGRVLIAWGRDAADVPIVNTFGPALLKTFQVWSDPL